MNVMHVITSLGNGGAQSVLHRLCTHDKSNNHIVVSMMDEGRLGASLKDNGVTVHCLHMARGSLSIKGVWQLWRLIRRYKPDVVQTWMYHPDLLGGILARLAGVKKVYWGIRHSSFEEGATSRSTVATAKVCAFLSRWIPRKIICCAHKAADIHKELGYKGSKCIVIPNGYDLSSFYPNPQESAVTLRKLDIPENLKVLGMVGRFNAQKDHEGLLKALGMVKSKGHDFRCLLIGVELESNNEKLMAWIDEYNLEEQIKLLGPRTDIVDLMNVMDIHILSSSFGEAFPNVIAEAMACGTPCVATDVGDTALIINDAGWVVPPSDSHALAEAIIHAMGELENSPLKWAERQQASVRQIQSNFTLEKMIGAFNRAWSS